MSRLIDADYLLDYLRDHVCNICPDNGRNNNVMCGACYGDTMLTAIDTYADSKQAREELMQGWFPGVQHIDVGKMVYGAVLRPQDGTDIQYTDRTDYKGGD